MSQQAHEEMKKRVAEMREAKAKRAEEAEAKALSDELVEGELELKFEKDLAGTRGVAFEIIGTPDGFIVVKLGEWVHYKRFMASKRDASGIPLAEDMVTFALANLVYPDREKFLAITNRYGAVATRCSNAIAAMHQGRNKDDEGKY